MSFPMIEKAVAAGVNGFNPGPLHDWSIADLHGLIAECEAYQTEKLERLHKEAEKAMFQPAVFFSKAGVKAVIEIEESAKWNIIGFASEMCAAAMLFLPPEELAKYPDPEEQG